jgi:hypothetical protein
MPIGRIRADVPVRRPDPQGRGGRGLLRGLLFAFLCILGIAGTGFLPQFSPTPAYAQFWGGGWGDGYSNRPPRPSRPIPQQQQRRQQPNTFGFPSLFGNPGGRDPYRQGRQDPYQTYQTDERQQQRPRRQQRVDRERADATRAPAARRLDAEPAKKVVVLGDSMADWLAYGLEEAFAESSPDLGVVRKHRTGSTLLRNDPRDFDWSQGAREALAGDKVDFAVMMIGLSDRHAIRERPPLKLPAPGQPPTSQDDERKGAGTLHEFRSEKWIELYTKRLDEVIAVLKAKKVPVLWVGLPPIRGPRARSDLSFLNELFKARAERAGITYVDVWEGFVDEDGEYSQYGPDVLGQVRRLRAGDGVHFTRFGARKLAHFVDREIKRLLSRETTPVALPLPEDPQPAGPPSPSGPAPRPVAGPVVPLTGGTPAAESLLGARAQDAQAGDPVAIRVLVKGEPPPPQQGRADSFVWPSAQTVAANDVAEPPAEPATLATARPATRTVAPRPGQRSRTRSAGAPARPVR